jgi:hypothetical protein
VMLGACSRAVAAVACVEVRDGNCCSKRGRRSAGIRGSCECVGPSDTRIIVARLPGAWGRISARLNWHPLRWRSTALERTATPLTGADLTTHELRCLQPNRAPPTAPTTPQRDDRKHGRPLRGLVALRDYHRRTWFCTARGARLTGTDVRLQRRLGRQAQGDAERRQEGAPRH